ncbi:MAG: RhoGAP domain-containing protein [Janthinobacterium lividum]
MVVYQCIQAVDLFGLEMEGIYRLSGNAAHIIQLKTLFDHGMGFFCLCCTFANSTNRRIARRLQKSGKLQS